MNKEKSDNCISHSSVPSPQTWGPRKEKTFSLVLAIHTMVVPAEECAPVRMCMQSLRPNGMDQIRYDYWVTSISHLPLLLSKYTCKYTVSPSAAT